LSKCYALAANSGGQAIAGFSEHEGIRDISEAGLLDFEPEESTSLTGYTAVSEGQRQHIDYLLSIVDDDLAWVALAVIKEYGLPSKEQYAEYMSQFAGSGLDDESDRRALELLDEVRHSDWDKRLAQADSAPVETRAQDLADNTIEGLTVIEVKTGRTLLNRTGVLGADGKQYVGLQDYEVEAFKGLDLIFIHNHPNGSDASEADLRAAFAAGAEMLMVVTPQGYEYVYVRGARGMIRIRAEEASYEVAPGTAEEHALLEARSWAQARMDRLNPPEWMMLQEEQYVAVHVKGNLNLYGNEEAVLRSEAIPDWSFSFDETRLRVLDQSHSDPYAVKIEFGGSEFWIDLRDSDAELEFRRVDLASSPFTSRRVQVSGQSYDNTSFDFQNALIAATIPPLLQSFVVNDEAEGGTLDIELSHSLWVDSGGKGILTRDLNPHNDTFEFQLQSPTVGPDVRVEIRAEGHKDLGNYVVISFPASVLRAHKGVMQRLAEDPDHKIGNWQEDGRIFMGFAHLSKIEDHIQPGASIESNALIGVTGNTGTQINHLDLAIVYVGSQDSGTDQMETAMAILSPSRDANSLFGFAQRSNFVYPDPHPNRTLYAENIDPVRVWTHLDESEFAKDARGRSLYAQE